MFHARRDPDDALRAILLTVAPAMFAPVLNADPLTDWVGPPFALPAVAAACVSAPSLFKGVTGRLLATFGLLLACSAWVVSHLSLPGLGALVLIGMVALLAGLWPPPDGSVFRALPPAPTSAATVLLLVGYGWSARLVGPLGEYGVAGAAAMSALLAVRASQSGRELQVAWGVTLAAVAWVLLRAGEVVGPGAFPLLALGPLVVLSQSVPPTRMLAPVARVVSEVSISSPSRLLVSGFAAASIVGTVALALPLSDAAGRGLALVDAAFLAVSAVTVTGLVTVDPSGLSTFGQLVVFVLVQLGGLGIMTFAGAAAEWSGARLGVRHEGQVLGQGARQDLRAALRRVVAVALVAELVGAALLLPPLISRGHGFASLGESVFLSVSAFCNAGFTPWSGNLVPFARDPWLLLVVSGLSLAGALGPTVLLALPAWVRGDRVPMWVRLTLAGNALLTLAPFPVILGLEWARTLSLLPAHDRVVAAILLTVSPRTAGFTSVPLDGLEPATQTLLSLLMFVGGNTGSSAGGVKVSTMAVLLITAFAAARGRRSVEYGARQVPSRIVFESVAIVASGVATAALGLVLLQLTQPLSLDRALFEVVSAVSTCGLSTGGTAAIDGVGKIVLFACMFAGRVGPLTLFLLLASGQDREGGTVWPSEEVPVG